MSPPAEGASDEQAASALPVRYFDEFNRQWQGLIESFNNDNRLFALAVDEEKFLDSSNKTLFKAREITAALTTAIDSMVGGWHKCNYLKPQPDRAPLHEVLQELIKLLRSKPPFNGGDEEGKAEGMTLDKFKPQFEDLDKRITVLIDANQVKGAKEVDDKLRQYLAHSLDSLRQEEFLYFKQHALAKLAAALETHKAIQQLAKKYCK